MLDLGCDDWQYELKKRAVCNEAFFGKGSYEKNFCDFVVVFWRWASFFLLREKSNYSVISFTISLRSLPHLKKGRRLGFAMTVSPVLGLRP